MIDLFYIACRQTDLVAIGAVAFGSPAHQFFLGQLALQGILHRDGRIRSSGDTHRLIHIGTA